jgi:hypothetical protein
MWEVRGEKITNANLLIDPTPVRVLYDFDGPRIFVCENKRDDLFLAYQCGEEDGVSRFLVVPCDPGKEWQLRSGQVNLLDALSHHKTWIMDLAPDWSVKALWEVDHQAVPAAVLPKPGVMLYRHLKPTVRRAVARSNSSQTTLPPFPQTDVVRGDGCPPAKA